MNKILNKILYFDSLERPAGVSILVESLIMVTFILSSFVFFKQPFEFYFHYLIFLGLLPFLFLRYGIPVYVLKILLYTLVVGLAFVVFNDFAIFQFIKVWGGLTLSLTFYSLVVRYFQFDVHYIFKRFIQWSYFTCIIGVVQVMAFYGGIKPLYNFSWILNKWGFNQGGVLGVRINSIYSEPSTVAVVIAPVAYIALYNLIHRENFILNKIQSFIVLIVYLGSSSSTAFIGLFIILILVTDSIKLRYAVVGFSLAAIAGWALYSNVEEFRSRVDTSIALWYYQDYRIQNTNTSSFVLYNNFNVSMGSFQEYPIFGTGLGSYEYAYEKHTLTKTVIGYDFEFNKTDGNSMLLRLIVETGLIGVLFIGILIFRGFIKKSEIEEFREFRIVSHAIFVMMALYLLRQGNYFLNALPMFYLIYYYNWKDYTRAKLVTRIDKE